MTLPPTNPNPENPPAAPGQAAPLWRQTLRRVGALAGLATLLALLSPVLIGVLVLAPGPLSRPATIVVAHGAGTAAIAAQLADAGTVYSPLAFRLAARLMANGSLKAGEYALPAQTSIAEIVAMMHEGRSVVRMLTIAEGLTSADIVDRLRDEEALSGTIDAIPAEGTLVPEPYRDAFGDTRAGVIQRMQKAMQERLATLWAGRAADLPLASAHDAVILASVVEKETGKREERPRIAGVFFNRLRQGMRLQSDPTVIYALTRGQMSLDRPLTHEDLSFASPINTYVHDGLPTQPICNPGYAALAAVLHPEHHDLFYFVADGSGGHAFARDLAEHNRNINAWHRAVSSMPHTP